MAVCHQLQPQDLCLTRAHAWPRATALVLRGVGGYATTPRISVLPHRVAAICQFLPGSNELLDFSGYFEGIEHLLSVLATGCG